MIRMFVEAYALLEVDVQFLHMIKKMMGAMVTLHILELAF